MSDDADLQWLMDKARNDDDVAVMVNTILHAEGCSNLFALRELREETYEALLTEARSLVEQMGEL